jgi:hypothetical protein
VCHPVYRAISSRKRVRRGGRIQGWRTASARRAPRANPPHAVRYIRRTVRGRGTRVCPRVRHRSRRAISAHDGRAWSVSSDAPLPVHASECSRAGRARRAVHLEVGRGPYIEEYPDEAKAMWALLGRVPQELVQELIQAMPTRISQVWTQACSLTSQEATDVCLATDPDGHRHRDDQHGDHGPLVAGRDADLSSLPARPGRGESACAPHVQAATCTLQGNPCILRTCVPSSLSC